MLHNTLRDTALSAKARALRLLIIGAAVGMLGFVAVGGVRSGSAQAVPHYDPSQFACSPNPRPGLAGSWQTSAPRDGADFAQTGNSVDIGLRNKFGAPSQTYDVMATVFAPDGSVSAQTTVLAGSDWATLTYPDDFDDSARNDLSGVYTVLWTVGPLNLACDGFVLH